MTAPTVPQGAPFIYTIPCDNSFNSITPGSVQSQNPSGAPELQNSNIDGKILIGSASQGVGTVNSGNQTNVNARGIIVYVNITVIGTGNVITTIQSNDPVAGVVNLFVSAAASANGVFSYVMYPGAVAGGAVTAVASFPCPRTWRVSCAVGTGAVTFGVSFAYML